MKAMQIVLEFLKALFGFMMTILNWIVSLPANIANKIESRRAVRAYRKKKECWIQIVMELALARDVHTGGFNHTDTWVFRHKGLEFTVYRLYHKYVLGVDEILPDGKVAALQVFPILQALEPDRRELLAQIQKKEEKRAQTKREELKRKQEAERQKQEELDTRTQEALARLEKSMALKPVADETPQA